MAAHPVIEHSGAAYLEDSELARLVARAPAGEAREAEAELCRRLAPRVRLYGLRHLRDEQAAADLTQHVLIIMLESLRAGRVKDPGMLASFVLGTCRMAVMDVRRNALRKERLLQEYARDLAPAVIQPSPSLADDSLEQCLERLPEREKTVVVLTFFHEQPGAEVAGTLGLSHANVRVIRHRALHRLRECLSGAEAA